MHAPGAGYAAPVTTEPPRLDPASSRESAAHPGPRITVVIPTFQRREVVTGSVLALAEQTGPTFDVVVVVDGSTDGTADALRSMTVPFGLRVIEQANSGASMARNHGARIARGEVLLFLDDDMQAAPNLLAEHDRAHARGAEAVFGHIPVHPDAPSSILLPGLVDWAVRRRDRLSRPEATLTFADLLTGQLSVRRSVFEALGGFDEDFTRGGSFGREDTDFGRRLFSGGHRVEFAPDAISWQLYVVRPAAYLRQWNQAGRADVTYMRKHPEEIAAVHASRRPGGRVNRYLWRPLSAAPGLSRPMAAAARQLVLLLVDRRPDDPRSRRLFFKVRDLEYWRGLHAGGGVPLPRPVRVLCYHAVRDLAGVPVIEQYGVPPRQLAAQLRALRWAGYRFVSLDEVLRSVDGEGGLPRRPVLLTFDDCFVDLLEHGVPVLRAAAAPAAAFAVAGRVGGTNAWDERLGAPRLPLLDAEGLRALERAGVEVGVHGSTHRPLTAVARDELDAEIAGAAATLTALGLRMPRAFAYPHGDHDKVVRDRIAAAGLRAAFTVRPGLVRAGDDRYALHRIEVMRRDGAGLRLILKVASAGRFASFGTRSSSPVKRARSVVVRVVRQSGQTANTR